MACEIVTHGRVVLVVWGKPELRDVRRLENEVRNVHEAFGPVVFIARVPPQASVPDGHVREAIGHFLGQFTSLCLSYHAVFEGDGLTATTKRAALAAIFRMTGKHRRYFVHSTCNEVTLAVPNEVSGEVWSALREFRARELLKHELHSLPSSAVGSKEH